MPDIYPYNGRPSGPGVSNIEHERLWAWLDDGILPDQASNALLVLRNPGTDTVTVYPGRIHICGHVLDIEETTITLPTAGNRTDVIAAYLDRSNSPTWSYGVERVQGANGGGRPPLSKDRSLTGKYQVALRAYTVASTGEITQLPDERPFLGRLGSLTQTEPPAFRGHVAYTPGTNDGGWQLFGTLTEDYSYGVWDTAGHSSIRVAPVSGLYAVTAQVQFEGTNSNSTLLGVRIVKDATAGQSDGTPVAVDNVARNTARIATVRAATHVRLNAGQRISAQRTQIGGGSSVRVQAGSEATYFDVAYVRPL